jgi:hypothetical protein
MRLLAGRAYSAGINRLVFHGIPYPYTRADGESWFPFSGGFGRILAGPFPMSSKVDHEFLAEIGDFNAFLARLSVAMSQGRPAADVAWLRADPVYPDAASLELGKVDPRAGESATTRAFRARGLVHDRISRRMLSRAIPEGSGFRVGARTYQALVIDSLPVAEPLLIERILALAEAGIPVIALGELPDRAPGLREAEPRDKRVREAAQKLSPLILHTSEEGELESWLEAQVAGALVEPLSGKDLSLSLDRRETPQGDILFVFNESWSPVRESIRFTRDGSQLTLWDPWTGESRRLRERVTAGESVVLEMKGAESLVLTLNRSE